MNVLTRIFFTLVTTIGLCAAAPAFADEHASKDEAKAMVEAAIAHVKKVGVDKAYDDFNNDKTNWIKKDLYVFGDDFDGVLKVNGINAKLIGKSVFALKDQNGKEFVKEMIAIVTTKGEGWVDYDWFNPVTKKVDAKSSYVKRIPGRNEYLGVGVYR